MAVDVPIAVGQEPFSTGNCIRRELQQIRIREMRILRKRPIRQCSFELIKISGMRVDRAVFLLLLDVILCRLAQSGVMAVVKGSDRSGSVRAALLPFL